LSFAQLRDALLAIAPLNKEWVKEVNGAEAECWKRSEGYAVGRNVDLLQVDVLEVVCVNTCVRCVEERVC
jgi:hypothetical protein